MPIGRQFALTERKERLCARSHNATLAMTMGTRDCNATLAMTVFDATSFALTENKTHLTLSERPRAKFSRLSSAAQRKSKIFRNDRKK